MSIADSKPAPGSAEARRPGRKFFLVALAVLLVASFAAWHLSSWPTRLRYPGDWSSIEGMPLTEMLHLRQGITIYDPFLPERFDTANYGPLYYLLGAQLINPRAPAYFPLRLLSTLATLGCAAGCGLLAFWLTRSLLAFVLAPLLFLAQALVTYYCCSARCDSVALLLSFWGLLAAFYLRERAALLFAAPLMLLGFFYKQQFIAAPLAVLLYLLLGKRYRLAALFGAVMALGGLSMLAFFQFVVFPGQAFFQHFFSYNLLPFSWSRLAIGLPIFGIVCSVPLLVGIEFLRQRPHGLLRCYLGCAVAFAVMPIGRQGSDTNYFLECFLLLSSLFAALLAETIANRSRAKELLALLGTTVLVGQLFTPPPPRPDDFQRDRAVQNFLRQNFSPGTPALGYYTGDLVRAGLEVPISNLFHYTWLIRKGSFSEQSLLTQIQSRRFGLVVVNNDLQTSKSPDEPDAFWTESLRKAILLHYKPMARLEMPAPEMFRGDDRFYVWVPRPGLEADKPSLPCN